MQPFWSLTMTEVGCIPLDTDWTLTLWCCKRFGPFPGCDIAYNSMNPNLRIN